MIKETTYQYNNVTYKVVVEYKRIRNTYFRFKDGAFYVTSNYLVPISSIKASLDKFAPRLLKKKAVKEPPYGENYLYLFGEKTEISSDIEDTKALDKYLKKTLLEYLNKRVPILKSEMGIAHTYKIRVRKMKSRYGSDSRKTMSLAFNLSLVHYSPEIIDSVVIHELVHDKVFNHSEKSCLRKLLF